MDPGPRARRIIPAYAGSTATCFLRSPNSADHPRIRGEHRCFDACGIQGPGSSPHTRGAQVVAEPRPQEQGIIPAYAGSTVHLLFAFPEFWDHPRIRGEHCPLVAGPLAPMRIIPAYAGSTFDLVGGGADDGGSSPHTRGARRRILWRRPRGRIIPAYAGSTSHAICRADAAVGSSPHTRGALDRVRRDLYDVGIIPAYAGSTLSRSGRRRRVKDHPRIRGEHVIKIGADLSAQGSSPHTRGARPSGRRRQGDDRIIPAYAGSTCPVAEKAPMIGDHPRIRGEHILDTDVVESSIGSSPHTRGAPHDPLRGRLFAGIIPAYAGSTVFLSVPGAFLPDHPRIRGEHDGQYRPRRRRQGSSPHTRGARSWLLLLGLAPRIIPAYAGSTDDVDSLDDADLDHPRIRGEHYGHTSVLRDDVGSSPHTRGAPAQMSARPNGLRIIPAYAGSTGSTSSGAGLRKDHPRIRGEHALTSDCSCVGSGSSPHTRGARSPAPQGSLATGIIPAYAGSTMPAPSSPNSGKDHPRIRGEHNVPHITPQVLDGSSPHTRGARPVDGDLQELTGIIPAYAGSTACSPSMSGAEADHPRIRGEHVGKTPRRLSARRIIPAYAGSTQTRLQERPNRRDHPRIRGEHRYPYFHPSE